MDISVYDNYSDATRDFDFFFIDGKYKTCNSMLAIMCIEGEATFKIRIQDFPLTKSDYMILRPDTPFYIKKKSPDFKIDVIRISAKYIDELRSSFGEMHPEWFLYDFPANHLDIKKAKMFHILHSYLKNLLKTPDSWYRNQVIMEYLRIFYLEACHIWEESAVSQVTARSFKRERIITSDFFRLVDKNFREDRRVESYAEKIGISAKHLSHTIMKTTGKYPSDWLEDYALLEAKKMLRSSGCRIQDISYDLNFATPSHFGRFFKDKTGMTPKEFRNQELTIIQ